MPDREKKLGNLNGFTGGNFAGNVYDKNMLSPTISTMSGGGQQPMIIEEPVIVAMRGRNPEKPTDRTAGLPTEQRLEPAEKGMVNTLTTVQKDNLVLIKQATKDGSIECKIGGCFDSSYPGSKTRRGRVQEKGDVVPTLTASNSESINYVESRYRIRKLTEKETWRLMGFTDTDFEKARAVNSATQCYKQSGNSIVKQVLMALFSQLNIKGVKAWNETATF